MDLLHRIVLPVAIAWTQVARENTVHVPLVVSCVLVSSALLGFLVRGRRNNSGPSGVKEDIVEVINDSIIELHKPSGIPSVQVLFFHGLPFEKSSRVHLTTWECGDGSYNLWPQTWLVEEVPGAHVFVVRYSQGLSKDSRKTVDMKIIGENLLSDLMQGNIGQVQGCPVVLVGHSVGGLVIKQLCSEAHETLSLTRDSSNGRARVQLENFLNRIRGIFYYATPHHGIPHIVKATDLLDSPLFKYFHTLSTQAERLNFNFSRLRIQNSKWQIKGLAENLPVNSGVFRDIVVVPEAAAREGELNVEIADHFSISKPPSKTSRRFNAVTGLIHNVLANTKEDACPRNLQFVPEIIQGINSPLQDVKERLKTVTSLCLTGMGGLGKSTLAKIVFNKLAAKFEYTCFVSDVKLIKGNEEALKEEVWKRMYHNGKKVERESDWSNLRGTELLLVLDDISTERDTNVLSEIANGSSLVSRFLATSRDHRLLDNTYEVPLLNADYAQQLFVSRAFPNQVTPPGTLASLVEQVVKKCEGLPLTLEVVGQYLRGRHQEEDWKQALHALGKAEAVTGLNESLWEKLRLSYNGLEKDEKQIFLDATTFFGIDNRLSRQWTLREAKIAWREAYHVSENLLWRTLVERSLVYDVKEDRFIEVHEQLRSLGQKIALESNDKRRVWETPKGFDLLQSPNESEKQNIHSLRVWPLGSDNVDEIHVASPNLPQLKNMLYLQARVPFVIESNLEHKWFPRNLVLLDCRGLQLFDPARQSRLVILALKDIYAEHLPKCIRRLSGLRDFRLSNAPNLLSLPGDIGQLSQLESLTLHNCTSLETLPDTFVQLSNLKDLTLSGCTFLRTLPKSFGNLFALRRVNIISCSELQTLPESFGQLCVLTHLEIRDCDEFHSLPESFGALSALVELRFAYCHKLESLPDSFGNLAALSHLEFWACAFQSLPESFGNLITLSHVTFDECISLQCLPETLGQLAKLEYLKISKASEVERLPNSLAELNGLRHLIIDSTSIKSIPDYMRTLPSLQTLELRQLPYVKELPPWLGETGQNSLACSEKIFQVREQQVSLIGDKWLQRESEVVIVVHARFMKKVMQSDYSGALAAFSISNLRVSLHQGFVLQEKGIAKRMMGNLPGAVEDLTAALEIFSKIEDGACQMYDCFKHRGYVNFLMGTLESAENDGTMALKSQLECRENQFLDLSPTLGEEQVTYMHFKLEGRKEMYKQSITSLHDQVVQKVTASGAGEDDFRSALASFDIINLTMLTYRERSFFLKERGILKRLAGDLGGALEDLTAALEMGTGQHTYECVKHRGFVKYLLDDIEGAREDAERAWRMSHQDVDRDRKWLGRTAVSYLGFNFPWL